VKSIVTALKIRRVVRGARRQIEGYEDYARGVRDFGIKANRARYAGYRVRSLMKNGLNMHEATMVWEAAKDIGVRRGSRMAQKTWRDYAKKKAAQED